MTKYILRQPRDPEHESQAPHFTWWRILELEGRNLQGFTPKGRCIALIEDKTNAETIRRMLGFRHDALLEVKAKERKHDKG